MSPLIQQSSSSQGCSCSLQASSVLVARSQCNQGLALVSTQLPFSHSRFLQKLCLDCLQGDSWCSTMHQNFQDRDIQSRRALIPLKGSLDYRALRLDKSPSHVGNKLLDQLLRDALSLKHFELMNLWMQTMKKLQHYPVRRTLSESNYSE